MSERVGEQFGDYRLTRRLGGGTFGDVYLGEHMSKNTPAAVKVLQARLINAEDLKDYINEIRSLFRLQHPNIVPLLDFGIERDTPFLIMAYAPNGTLRQPKGTRLPLDTVVAYIQQIAEALQHAHDLKLIHRDVKPDNILSGPNGQVWLSDFGIVSIAHSSRSLNTQDGAGTIPYMAPEQILAYAPNGTLRQPKGTRLPLDTVVNYIKQIAEALQHAHDLKLIHRDVKPDNILSGPNGQIWLSDFGIVSIAHSSRSLNTQDGAGTIPYMAPEQILGKPRLASDQYALGIIAYEWICGSRPFNGTAIEIAMQHAQAKPPSLLGQVPMLTPAIEQVVLKALAKDPKGRFISVREFAEALATAVEESKPRPVVRKTKGQWVREGLAFRDAGKYREAIEVYSYAIQLDPGYAWAYFNRGIAYHRQKDYSKAIADYTRAIELNPGYTMAYINRGASYNEMKDFARAIEDHNCAIKLDPRNAEAYANRGIAYRHLKDYIKAIKDYTRAIELGLKHVNTYGGRGVAYYYLNDYQSAIQDLDYALQLNPSTTWFKPEREDAYRKLNKRP